MNIKINYLDNILPITDDKIISLEIENKECFYRTIVNFIQISAGELIEDFYFFDNQKEEIKLFNKILLITDYFNFDIVLKKYSTHLQKMIIENTNEEIVNDLAILYKKFIEKIKKSFESIDFSINFNDEFSLEQIVKFIKPTIKTSKSLLNNLYLIIDLEKTFNINKILVFVNLKQYLTKEEVEEFYKYCIYNKIKILLIENKSYQSTLQNEQKLIIDNDLDEFML